jgi:hypothetical protein
MNAHWITAPRQPSISGTIQAISEYDLLKPGTLDIARPWTTSLTSPRLTIPPLKSTTQTLVVPMMEICQNTEAIEGEMQNRA